MALPRTIDATQMRSINRSAVLELVRQQSPIARSEIGRRLGLSLPTVMRVIEQLQAEEMVRHVGRTEWSSGRPRQLLEFNKDGHAVVGVDLGGTNMYGALANIGGEILAEVNRDGHGTTGDQSFEAVVDVISQLLAAPRRPGQNVRGVAVAAPGVTRSAAGVVEWAPSLGWRDYPLKQKLEQRLALPVVVDNDLNLAALGEHWFGAGQGVANMVLMAIGTGIGAGIIIDSALYRGHTESAGEVGFLLPGCEALGKSYEGFGALERLASGTGIVERARKRLAETLPAQALAELSSHDVFDAARRGETWACDVVDETADYLAIAVANLSAILDPEVIILGGGVANSADLLIGPILRRISGAIPRVPRLVQSRLGPRAVVMGAVVLVLHETSDYYVVRKLS